MTVSHGRDILAIPGPTTIPDAVLSAMHRPAIDIYGGSLIETTASCLEDLKRVFRTAGRTYIYIANGHGAWEAALSNVLSRGDKVLALESGGFGTGWGEMGRALGIEVEVLRARRGRAVEPRALGDRLRADGAGEIKAVLAVQVDTASSVLNDIEALRGALDAAGHGALFMVDAIASLATMPFDMDGWGVDVAVAGSQKGLMLPPGLSFVAAGRRALEAHRGAGARSRYWDWTQREGEAHYMKYCGTPPEHMLFGLRKALDMLFEEGLDRVFRRHALLAGAVRAAVERWSEGDALGFHAAELAERADSVTTVMTDGFDVDRLLAWCAERCGVTFGLGLGPFAGRALRIAHMGHVNAPTILGALGVLETGLIALDVPHGAGGAGAAVAHLGRALEG